MPQLRVGFIGAGSYAVNSHIPALIRHPNVELVIVNRRDGSMAERIRSEFGFRSATTRWQDVIDEQLDVVFVTSPAAAHPDQVQAALESGAHVMCEKPFTIDPADAWKLVDTAQKCDREVVVAYGRNYNPMVLAAQELIDRDRDGGIGEIESVSMRMASVHRELLLGRPQAHPSASPLSQPNASTWVDPSISGGGYGQGQLSHILGASLWMTELRTASVSAETWSPPEGQVEYHVAGTMRFTNGAVGTISGASCHMGALENRQQFDIRIVGSLGQLHLDMERELVWRYRAGIGDDRPEFPVGTGRYDCIGPVDTILSIAAGGDAPNRSSAEVAARVVETLDGIYRSASAGLSSVVSSG